MTNLKSVLSSSSVRFVACFRPRVLALAVSVACVAISSVSALSAAFPIDGFKQFINEKPTIEKLEFEAVSQRFGLRGPAGPSYAFRSFELRYGSDSVYRLTETRPIVARARQPSRYNITKPVVIPALEQLEPTNRIFFWGRFESDCWSRFNEEDVLTTHSDKISNFGPARSCQSAMGFAYDLLNFGILDLGTNKVIWSGDNFTCPSNTIGSRIDGSLVISRDGVPTDLSFEIIQGEKRYLYLVTYGFDQHDQIPAFFPSLAGCRRNFGSRFRAHRPFTCFFLRR